MCADRASGAPLLVLDGDNLAHRAYHALPKSMTGAEGRPINAIVGWVNTLLNLWDVEQPRAVFTAWDTLEAPTFRLARWPTYQAGRVFDAEIVAQLAVLPKVARAFGLGVGKGAGFEADDFMASAAVAEARDGGQCLVLTADRDLYQVVSAAVMVLAPARGAAVPLRIGPAEVEAKWGIRPEQVPDFKALAGDPSDSIPGLRGVGPKKATALLQAHGSLEGVLAALGSAVEGEAERLRLFREIATVRTDLAVEVPTSGAPRWAEGAAFLRDLGAARVAARVAARS